MGDTLESLDRETTAEGSKLLAGRKSRSDHDAYMEQVEARLAAIGATWLDLLTLPRGKRSGEGRRAVAVGAN